MTIEFALSFDACRITSGEKVRWWKRLNGGGFGSVRVRIEGKWWVERREVSAKIVPSPSCSETGQGVS